MLHLALSLAVALGGSCCPAEHVPPGGLAARLAFFSPTLTGAGAAVAGPGGGGGGGASSQFFFPDGQDLILAMAAFN